MEAFLGGINWSFPTWDMFIYIFFFSSIVLYGFILGRDRILIILFSIYIALAVSSNLPFVNDEISQKFGFGPVFVMKLFIFAVIMAGLYIMFTKIGLLSSFSDSSGIFHIAIFSILHMGLIISIVLSFVPQEALNLSDFTKNIFVSDLARFMWMVAPLGAMFLAKHEEPEEDR